MVLTNVMMFGVLSPPRAAAGSLPEETRSETSPAVQPEPAGTPRKTPTPSPSPTPTPTPPLPCVPGTFTFSGTSATDGSDGNTRTFTQNGVTARVNAFSISKNNFNIDTAYLGLYPNGLGVTDRGEGNGSSNRFKTDNKGDHYNYVAFKLDRKAIFDRAFLNEVLTDSDASVFIATVPSSGPMTREEFSQFWQSLVFENNDGSSSNRLADFNNANKEGNLLIIGGKLFDSNDEFLINTLELKCSGGQQNRPPDAVNDSATVTEDSGANTIDVLANDTDPDGNALTISAVTQGTRGAVAINGSTIRYTPNANAFGTDTFTYTISDGQGGTDTATVSVTITGVNDAPDAVNDAATVTEDSSNTIITVLANDTDPDGNPLTITAVTQAANGTVVNNGTNVRFTPNANFNGATSFTYTISDGQGGVDTATVNVNVTPANDPPDAVNDSATVAEDSAATVINVRANDTDPDGNSLTITAVTQPANGSVINNGGTNVSFTPAANFNGSTSFTYTISDGQGGTDTATVAVTVTAVNDNPDAVNDAATVAENSSANAINVLANDTDADGNTLTVSAVTQGANGSVVNNGSNVSYTPNANFDGTDTFTYTVSDGNGGTDTATVTVTVTAGNVAPDAVNDSATVTEDSAGTIITVLANDTDADGNPLTITAVTQGANGSVVNNGTNVRYTPNANFSGSDTFTYTISDGQGGTDTATVSVTVTAVNDPPVANNDGPLTTAEDNALSIPSASLLANDTNGGDGGALTLTAVSATSANGGTVAINGANVIYTPAADFSGADSFTYTISDGTDTAVGTVSINVTDAPNVPVNLLLNEVEIDPPNATSFACQYAEFRGTPGEVVPAGTSFVSINGTPGNFGDVFLIAQLGGQTVGANGTITVINDVELCQNRTFPAGTTLVSVTNFSGLGENAARTFAIVNSATPLAEGTDIDVNNDRAIDANLNITVIDGIALTTNQTLEAAYAPIIFDASGAGTGLEHPDAATRFLADSTPLSAAAWYYGELADSPDESTEYLGTPRSANFPAGGRLTPGDQNTLAAVNNPPDAVDDAATVAEDSSNNAINVLANDTDADGNPLTITAVTQGANGSVVNNGTNVAYTPNANFTGSDSFTYTISDGQGGTDTATVSVTVGGTNDAPIAVNDAATVTEDSSANAINVLANDTDGDGDSLTVSAVTQGANGAVVNNGSNVSYTPNANFSGTDSFTYTVSDGNGGSATATVAVTVTGVNDAPDAVNDAATVAEDSSNNPINVLANDTDADGNTLTVSAVTQGANGSVANNGSNVSYTPNANFTGSDSFTYTVSDGNGGTDTATVSITVGGTNDAPDAVNDAATVAEDSSANVINVLANDTDGDGDSLTVSAVTQGANGSVVNNGTNVSYTPNANFSGSDSFTYTISDGNGGTDTATVNVTVSGVNDAPDAVNDSASVAEDSANNLINVLANDTDADGNTLTVSAVTQPANGSVINNGTNVSYTPNANFSGSDSFTYTISDGNGGTDTATVSVTVTGVNDPPVANNDAATVAEDTTNNAINVLANDTDGGDGGALVVTAVTQGANGSVTFTASGVSYTPAADFFGTDTFTYTVSDGSATAIGTVTVTVTDVPDTPSVALLVNEVEADAPDASFQFPCQYVELRGAPGYVVPAGTFFVSINGASGSFGDVSFIVDLGGQTVGTNGTISIINELEGSCPNRVFPAGTTLLSVQDFDGLGLIDGGARTFAIISAPTPPSAGDDLDTNNDRVIDPANGVSVVDGFGFTTNALFQTTYAPNLFDAATQGAPGTILLPDAATRFPGDTTPLSGAAWYFGELASSPAETTVYSGSPRSTNFPVGGALTPGAPNLP
jgi:large repetitive protein